jgi:hypothetical protein
VAGVDNDLEHPDVTYAHTLTQYHRHVTRFTLTRARDDSQVHAHDAGEAVLSIELSLITWPL